MSCTAAGNTGCRGNWWQRRWIWLDRCVICSRLFCETCLYHEKLYCSNCLLLTFDSKLHNIQLSHFTNMELCFYVSLFNLHASPQHLDRRTVINLLIECRKRQDVYPALRQHDPSDYFVYEASSGTHFNFSIIRETHHKATQVTWDDTLTIQEEDAPASVPNKAGTPVSPDVTITWCDEELPDDMDLVYEQKGGGVQVRVMAELCLMCKRSLKRSDRKKRCKVCRCSLCVHCFMNDGKTICMSCLLEKYNPEGLLSILKNNKEKVNGSNLICLYGRFVTSSPPPDSNDMMWEKIINSLNNMVMGCSTSNENAIQDNHQQLNSQQNKQIELNTRSPGEHTRDDLTVKSSTWDVPEVHSSGKQDGHRGSYAEAATKRVASPANNAIKLSNRNPRPHVEETFRETASKLESKEALGPPVSTDFTITWCDEELPDDMDLVYEQRGDASSLVQETRPTINTASTIERRSTIINTSSAIVGPDVQRDADIRSRKYSVLEKCSALNEVRKLSVAELKNLLVNNNVNIKGCCEKPELLQKAEELWNIEYQDFENKQRLSDRMHQHEVQNDKHQQMLSYPPHQHEMQNDKQQQTQSDGPHQEQMETDHSDQDQMETDEQKPYGSQQPTQSNLSNQQSYVAFYGNERLMGMGAKHQTAANLTNTVCGIKRLLGAGRGWEEEYANYAKLPFVMRSSNTDSHVSITVNYGGQEHQLFPEQLAAMLFTKFKDWAKMKLNVDNVMCVISVPSYFTEQQRMAILNSAHIAGLTVNRLLSDTAAICFTYGWHLTSAEGRNVAFVEMGHSSLQVSICLVSNQCAQVLALEVDHTLGGRDFDIMMANHLLKQFYEKHNISGDVYQTLVNHGAYFRLLEKVEEIKKKISINKATFPIKLESFVKNVDLIGEMSRSMMEYLCKDLIGRARMIMKECLKQSGLKPKDIHTVEAIGGSTRIPAIKTIIEAVFGSLSSTMNKNEAIASGCALQCAAYNLDNLKKYKVKDQLCHNITLSCDDEKIYRFKSNDNTPFTRKAIITWVKQRHQPLVLKAEYNQSEPCHEASLGVWTLQFKDISALEIIIIKVDKNGLLQCEDGAGHALIRRDNNKLTDMLEDLRQSENDFKKMDQEEEATAEARNTLEEFIYQNMPHIDKATPLYYDFERTLHDIRTQEHTKEFYVEALAELMTPRNISEIREKKSPRNGPIIPTFTPQVSHHNIEEGSPDEEDTSSNYPGESQMMMRETYV